MRDLIFNYLSDAIMDDNRRTKVLFDSTYAILCVISVIMTIMNVYTDKGSLTWATFIFAVCCAVDLYVSLLGKRGFKIASVMFSLDIIVLFVFFIVSGNPEGFSVIWIVFTPACALLLFGLKKGSLFSAVILAILIFFYWIPAGRALLMYNYTESFMMRFPVLFVAFYGVSFSLELIRSFAFRKYSYQCRHDQLTDAFNRKGFEEHTREKLASAGGKVGLMICDIDDFKKVNDKYGHFIGDEVLQQSVKKLEHFSGLTACRWGGEEFAFFDPDGIITEEYLGTICEQYAHSVLVTDDALINITVSIGAIICDPGKLDLNEMTIEADKCLYEAKNSGKNTFVLKKL